MPAVPCLKILRVICHNRVGEGFHALPKKHINATSPPQKHSRTAFLGASALLLVFSPHFARCILRWRRSQPRPLKNIVALPSLERRHCSLFFHLVLLAVSSAGGALGFAHALPYVLNEFFGRGEALRTVRQTKHG